MTALFGAYPGRHEGEVWLEGQPSTPARRLPIRAGLRLVPEDRKRQGIIPDLDVGQNITLAVLDTYVDRPNWTASTGRSRACTSRPPADLGRSPASSGGR